MSNYIFLIHAAHDFNFYLNLSKKKRPVLIITTSIMYNAVKYNFPNSDILKIFYFDLTKNKIQQNKRLLKNTFKLLINFLLIFYKFFFIKKKYNQLIIFFSHAYSANIIQAIGISKLFRFKIIQKIIENTQFDKDKKIQFYDKRIKIYEFLLLNKIHAVKNFLLNDIVFTSSSKYKKIFFIKDNLTKYRQSINNKYKFLINKKNILVFDVPIGRIENSPLFLCKIDQKKTIANLKSYFEEKRNAGYSIYFKKRFDEYYYEGPYFYDLIKNNKYIEINRYIPGEFLVNFFSYSFSIFSYSIGYAYSEGVSRKKYSENISNLIERIR